MANFCLAWPTYFDSQKSRARGRRVPRDLALRSPKVEEIVEASKKLRLKVEANEQAIYPSNPWYPEGFVLVEKKESKTSLIKKIAKEIRYLRKSGKKSAKP